MDEKLIRRLNAAISAVFIAAGVILLVSFSGSRREEAPPAAEPEAAAEEAAPELAAFGDLAGMERLELAKDFASWTPGAEVDDAKARSASLAVEGTPAKAFLTVRASLDGKPLTKYESVFVKFNDAGGHLYRPKSLPAPDGGATALLYDLSDVAVLPSVPYDESRTPETADLLAVLRPGRTAKLTAFISSLRPALIEEMTLHYVCAEGETCSVTLK